MDRFALYGGRKSLKYAITSSAVALLLAACGNSGSGGGLNATASGQKGPAPVSLVKSFGAQNYAIQTIALNSGAIAKAVDRYRINKKADPSPYKKVGVDLNGDGVGEALVYFTGDSWCASTGCTLVVFRSGQYGYRAVSTIKRVKAPVRVASTQSQGWNDLIVQTGGVAGFPERSVALKFTGGGYPGNATVVPPLPADAPVGGTVVMAAPPPVVPPASVDGPAPQGSPQPLSPISLQP